MVSQALGQCLLYLAHNPPLVVHQATDQTVARLMQCFYLPGIRAQVARYYAACPECQLTQAKGPQGRPMPPLPIVSPFEQIGIDFVGPLPSSFSRHLFILVVVDYSTCYLEIIPLAPEAKEKMAFAGPFGLYQFSKILFRLHGTASSFQRLMDTVLGDVKDCAVACINDILVFSKTWKDDLIHSSHPRSPLEGGPDRQPGKQPPGSHL